MCFNVSIIDDNIYEQDEVFFANITTSDPQITLSPNLTTLTIEFDDGIANNVNYNNYYYKQFPFLDAEKFHSMIYCEPPTIDPH